MANYIIIGGDQKEYGPITADDVRQWIAEGRLNEQSLMKAESDAEFRTLEKFPEFAASFDIKNSALSHKAEAFIPGDEQKLRVLKIVKAPSIALKITAIVNLVFSVWDLVKLIFFPVKHVQIPALEQIKDPQLQAQMENFIRIMNGPVGIISVLVTLVISLLIFKGAQKMQELGSYEFAFVAAILAMIPCLTPCCLIGFPFGIWALAVLCRKDVKSQFQ